MHRSSASRGRLVCTPAWEIDAHKTFQYQMDWLLLPNLIRSLEFWLKFSQFGRILCFSYPGQRSLLSLLHFISVLRCNELPNSYVKRSVSRSLFSHGVDTSNSPRRAVHFIPTCQSGCYRICNCCPHLSSLENVFGSVPDHCQPLNLPSIGLSLFMLTPQTSRLYQYSVLQLQSGVFYSVMEIRLSIFSIFQILSCLLL